MITLKLNELQRLNLEAFCDAQDGKPAILRRINKICDALQVSAERKKEIDYAEMPTGERRWDGKKLNQEPAEVSLEDSDAEMLRAKLADFEFPRGSRHQVRLWVDPVLDQIKPA